MILGLKNMKYIVMHWNDFERPATAFLLGWMQAASTIFVEIINLINLPYLSNIKEIIADFIALAVISEFDEIMGGIYSQSPFRVFFGQVYTTRNFRKIKLKKAGQNIANEDIPGVFGCCSKDNEARKCGCSVRGLLYITYRIHRFIFLTIYYYTFPFFAIVLSYWSTHLLSGR